MTRMCWAGVALSAVVVAACTGGSTDSPTNPTQTPPPAGPTPFAATLSAAGPYHLNDIGFGLPTERFDYAITPEMVDATLAHKHVAVSSLLLTGSATSNSDFALFDVEVLLNGATIGMPAGQATSTLTNPDRDITRAAASILKVVPFRNGGYNPSLTSNVDLGFRVQFTPPDTATTTPPLYNLKAVPATSFDLTDGLHMQIFLWTGSPTTDVTFRTLTLTVQGTAS